MGIFLFKEVELRNQIACSKRTETTCESNNLRLLMKGMTWYKKDHTTKGANQYELGKDWVTRGKQEVAKGHIHLERG